jgi:hypothetical protein
MSHLLQRLIARANAPTSPAQPVLPSVYASQAGVAGIEMQDFKALPIQADSPSPSPLTSAARESSAHITPGESSIPASSTPFQDKKQHSPHIHEVQPLKNQHSIERIFSKEHSAPPLPGKSAQDILQSSAPPSLKQPDPIAPRPKSLAASSDIAQFNAPQPLPRRPDAVTHRAPPVTPQAPSIEVNISIGHIEIRSATDSPAPRRSPPRPRVTLEGFLNRQRGEEHR